MTESVESAGFRLIAAWLEVRENRERLHRSLYSLAAQESGASPVPITQTVEDLYSESIRLALSKAEQYDPKKATVNTWLMGFARNVLRRIREERRNDRERFLHADQSAGEDGTPVWETLRLAADTVTDPETATVGGATVNEILSLVSESDRQILHLSVLQGWSGEEIAVALGIEPGTVRVRTCRARMRLQEAVRKSPLWSTLAENISPDVRSGVTSGAGRPKEIVAQGGGRPE